MTLQHPQPASSPAPCDRDPLDDAMARLYPELMTFAQLGVRTGHDRMVSIDDIVQSACRQLLTMRDRIEFRGDAALRALFRAIVEQKRLEKQRFHRAARRNLERDEQLDPHLDRISDGIDKDPAEAAASAEIRQQLAAAMARLPRADAQILGLRFLAGLDGLEIAATLGLTAFAARKRLARARRRLRESLERIGLDAATVQ